MTNEADSNGRSWRDRGRWFGAEILVVVAGVLIALAVQAWWSDRSDIRRERSYLQQLKADLAQTRRIIEVADSIHQPRDSVGAVLLRRFHAPGLPARDSVLAWYGQSLWFERPRPVLGTAEALVTTGDLSIIRNAELRSAITGYLNQSSVHAAEYDLFVTTWYESSRRIGQLIHLGEALLQRLTPAQVDSLALRDPLFELPPGARTHRFPLNVRALMEDRNAYSSLWEMNMAKVNMAVIRAQIRESAGDLEQKVDAALRESR